MIYRDLNESCIPYMDNDWIAGVNAPPDVERTPEMQKTLAFSAELIAELQAADVLLINTPMYDFTIPAVLKTRSSAFQSEFPVIRERSSVPTIRYRLVQTQHPR